MHIPDGFLDPEVCAVAAVLAGGAVAYSARRAVDDLGTKAVPLVGTTAALIFAGQMVNFPLPGLPVSGHLLGGVLAASIVGPWAGCLALSLVLVAQCLLFADGGLLALGANILNIAVVGVWAGHALLTSLRAMLGGTVKGIGLSTFLASWMSVMAACAVFSVEFAFSSAAADVSLSRVFGLMVAFHALIGIGEGLISSTIVVTVYRQQPGLLYGLVPERRATIQAGRWAAAGLAFALVVAALLSPFASEFPDGLEAVAERTGFADTATSSVLIWDDYAIPGIPEEWSSLSVALAGIIGTLVVAFCGWGIDRMRRYRTIKQHPLPTGDAGA